MRKVLMFLAFVTFLGFSLPVLAKEKVLTGETPAATASMAVAPKLEKQSDLTVPTVEKGRLERLIEGQKITGWWGSNFLKIAIRKAVGEGVSPNTLVLLFLFPLIAALVAFSRQVVGVSGFGMIVPALLSVAFLSTGGLVGLVLLAFIMLAATMGRVLIRKMRLPYLPKLSILIWLISMAVLGLLLLSPLIGLERLMGVGIFPIMLFVLLAETFTEAQITRTMSASLGMTLETVILALVAYKLMSSPWVQTRVLLQPELSVVAILVVDWLIGKYKGLRLSEVWRFRKLLEN